MARVSPDVLEAALARSGDPLAADLLRRLQGQREPPTTKATRPVPQREALAVYRRKAAQGDRLFGWLAELATRDDLRWFLQQEAAGEAGFDDLVAMTQIKLPTRPKLELARNYWDEMGQGREVGMHGPMLGSLVDTLALEPEIETTAWESLALANAMTAMASARRYAWHSVGALGVVELTAPGRSACTAAGLKRVGLSGKERRYFTLHAVLDVKHSEAWNREALRPLVEEDPRRATAIAEGALIRLRCGERCFERYRAHFGLA
jgi:hypothetical protein